MSEGLLGNILLMLDLRFLIVFLPTFNSILSISSSLLTISCFLSQALIFFHPVGDGVVVAVVDDDAPADELIVARKV